MEFLSLKTASLRLIIWPPKLCREPDKIGFRLFVIVWLYRYNRYRYYRYRYQHHTIPHMKPRRVAIVGV